METEARLAEKSVISEAPALSTGWKSTTMSVEPGFVDANVLVYAMHPNQIDDGISASSANSLVALELVGANSYKTPRDLQLSAPPR